MKSKRYFRDEAQASASLKLHGFRRSLVTRKPPGHHPLIAQSFGNLDITDDQFTAYTNVCLWLMLMRKRLTNLSKRREAAAPDCEDS